MQQFQVYTTIGLVIILSRTSAAHPGVTIQTFLNTDIQPAVLFVYDNKIKYPTKIPNRYKNSHLFSAIRIQDFLRIAVANSSWQSANPPAVCHDFHSRPYFPELVLIQTPTPLHLQLILQKISICLKSGWKPVFIVNYRLEEPLQEHLESLKGLVVTTGGISVNSQLFIVIDSVSKIEPTISSSENRRNKTFSENPTVWELFAIKHIPIIQQVRHQKEIDLGFDILAQLCGKAFRRFNFFQVPILGAVENSIEFPLESQLETVNGEVRFVSGYSVDIFRDLEYSLNFSAKAVQGEGYLSKDEVTSKWTGTGRQIMDKEIDIGVSMTLQYVERADFALLMPIYGGRVRAFFRQPDSTSIGDIFEHAFDRLVWMVTVGVFVFTFLMLKVMMYCKMRISRNSSKDIELTNDAALFVIASICQQGWHMHPTSTCLKIIFVCCSVSGFLVYVSFSAALVSTLTNEIIPIRTITDLLASSLSWIGDRYIPFVMSKLQNIYGLDSTTLEKRKIAFDSAMINPTLRIIQEPCAYLGFSDDFVSTLRMANISDRYFCDNISNVKVTNNRMNSGMVVRKDSPFREYFNYGIIKNIERGLNFANRDRYVRRSRIKCDERMTTYREDLETGDVFTAYVVLALGLAFSLLLASAERYFFLKNAQPLYFRLQLNEVLNLF
ncbi:unnamed protein product [Allacma fusca]|uniref:Ionotropic glutamate receptor C-terminal domain-containing protein n=1 Tax=Allacma fusca TaxID=39272 RepID=A0A8J2JFK5_9HEXA|nr:unnamed protein product [Allacma fusca]